MKQDQAVKDLKILYILAHVIIWVTVCLHISNTAYLVFCAVLLGYMLKITYGVHQWGFSQAMGENGLPRSLYTRVLFPDQARRFAGSQERNQKNLNSLLMNTHGLGLFLGTCSWTTNIELDPLLSVHMLETKNTLAFFSSLILCVGAHIIFFRVKKRFSLSDTY